MLKESHDRTRVEAEAVHLQKMQFLLGPRIHYPLQGITLLHPLFVYILPWTDHQDGEKRRVT